MNTTRYVLSIYQISQYCVHFYTSLNLFRILFVKLIQIAMRICLCIEAHSIERVSIHMGKWHLYLLSNHLMCFVDVEHRYSN